MEKIYSRKRLKFSKIKKLTKIKLAVLLIVLSLLLFIIQIIKTFYPIFEETCKAEATNLGTEITLEEVNKVMSNYAYNDLIYVERSAERRYKFNKN